MHSDRAGRLTVRLNQLFHRHLPPGSYRLDLTPRAQGKAGKTVSRAVRRAPSARAPLSASARASRHRGRRYHRGEVVGGGRSRALTTISDGAGVVTLWRRVASKSAPKPSHGARPDPERARQRGEVRADEVDAERLVAGQFLVKRNIP